MIKPEQVSPEFFKLFCISEQILTSFKLSREAGNLDWKEAHDLNDELDQILDKMTAMVVPQNIDKEADH